LGDCIKCVGHELIVSGRAAELLKDANVPEGTTFVPVDVLASDGTHLQTAVAVIFAERKRFVNLEASEYEEITEGIPWYFTRPPVVEAGVVHDLDLLYGFYVFWLCSNRLKTQIEENQLSNFVFEPVDLKWT